MYCKARDQCPPGAGGAALGQVPAHLGEMDFRDFRNKFKPKRARPGCADAAVTRGAGASRPPRGRGEGPEERGSPARGWEAEWSRRSCGEQGRRVRDAPGGEAQESGCQKATFPQKATAAPPACTPGLAAGPQTLTGPGRRLRPGEPGGG